MIHWLTQSKDELPRPHQTCRQGGSYLNDVELARLESMASSKRQQDWMLGRWTAKRLLQTILWETQGVTISLDQITIHNTEDGVPYVQLPTSNNPLSISISHSHDHAFVAAVEKLEAPIGADMEKIVPRAAGFAREYFTDSEMSLGEALSGQARHIWETAVWSAKEAVLKALHLGLSVDTRAVCCLIEPIINPGSGWLPYQIRYEKERLPKSPPALCGWWRVEDSFVLTIALD